MDHDRKSRILRNIGMLLIIIACLLWLSLFLVHLLPIAPLSKVGVYTGLIIAAEVLFWPGSILLGAEWAMKMRKIINPIYWFHKRTKSTN